jgi:hypothetical protein
VIRSKSSRLAVTAVGFSALVVGASCRDRAKEQPAQASASSSASSAPSVAAPTPSAAVNALPIPSASVAALVNPGDAPAYDGPVGSVEGTVYVDGDPAPDADPRDFSVCPTAAPMYKKAFREGAATGPNGSRPLADAVVGATGYKAFVPERAPSKLLVYDDCTFGTRTIAMTFGQRIEVANKTKRAIAPGLDQLFSPALMIAPPEEKGDPVKIYPERPGFFTMSDRLGAQKQILDVYVLLFPTHDVTNVAGHFRIDGIPVGTVDVFARLRAVGQETSQKVEIRAGVVQKVDLTLHYRAPTPSKVDGGARQKVIP